MSVLALASAAGLCVVGDKLLRKNAEVRELVGERGQYELEVEKKAREQQEKLSAMLEAEDRYKKEISTLEAGKKALGDLIGSKNRDIASLKKPVKGILESLLDIYAIKYEANNPVLRELENESSRSTEVRKKWEEICAVLESDEEFQREASLLRLRMAQSYMAAGEWAKVDVSKVDWKLAGLEERRADILTRLYYGMAESQMVEGKRELAAQSLRKCMDFAAQMPEGSESKEYAQAMVNMLQAKVHVSENPAVALKHYIIAIGHLRKVVVDMPDNVPLRCTFSQACMDGALMAAGGESAGWSEKLRKEAHGHAYLLTQRHPELKMAHELCAENDVVVAEQKLRDGEVAAVEPLLRRAEQSLEQCGGSPVLEASIMGVRAFMAWDKGEREVADELMQQATGSMHSYSAKHPDDVEAKYRLASLLWERSAMRANTDQAIEDGRQAATLLADLVNGGAGRREASARRMIAIIFGDIGHLAAEEGKPNEAKQYFSSARDQWSYLSSKWGECDEYREGKRWCTSRIDGL